jgi:hypothetical protein
MYIYSWATSIIRNFCGFGRVCKIAKSDYYLRHVYLSVCIDQLGSRWKDFREI